MQPGIRFVHKPAGPTSASLVREVVDELAKRGVNMPVSHGGTLDPFAEGLVLLLAGQATRLIDHLHAVPKIYEAEVAWGVETDNGDPGGIIVRSGDASGLTAGLIDAASTSFVGWHEQVPPATSAKRVGGERAYEKAHRGEVVELPPSRVYLHELTWLSHDLPRSSRVRLCVRGGFYVRSFVRDLGRSLGCGAHVLRLSRAAIGPWSDPGPGRTIDVSGEGLLPWLRARVLSDDEWQAVAQGRPIPAGLVTEGSWRVPAGFPEPAGPVRGLYRRRLVSMLREDGAGGLTPLMNLRGGL